MTRSVLVMVALLAGCEWLAEDQLPCRDDEDCFEGFHCEGAADPDWGLCAEGAPITPRRQGDDDDDDDATGDDDDTPTGEVSGVLFVEYTLGMQPDAIGTWPDDGVTGGATMLRHSPAPGSWLTAPDLGDCEVDLVPYQPAPPDYLLLGSVALTGAFGEIPLTPDEYVIYRASSAPGADVSFAVEVNDLTVPGGEMPSMPYMTGPSPLWQQNGAPFSHVITDSLTLTWQPAWTFDVFYVVVYGFRPASVEPAMAIYCTTENDGSFSVPEQLVEQLPQGWAMVQASHQRYATYDIALVGTFEFIARTHMIGSAARL